MQLLKGMTAAANNDSSHRVIPLRLLEVILCSILSLDEYVEATFIITIAASEQETMATAKMIARSIVHVKLE